MNDSPREQHPTTEEPELAARFARLRGAEAATAPAIPHSDLMSQATASAVWWETVPARVAAAVAVVSVGVALLWQPVGEDPAELYLSIVGQQSWQTDSLLDASAALLPTLGPESDFYSIDLDLELNSYAN